MGAVHNKINISVTAEAVRVHTHRNCFRPRFVIVGNASIKIFLTHGISKDIEYPLISKLFYYLFYTCRIKPIIPIMNGNRMLNRFFTGNVCPIGRTVLFQFSMLIGITPRIGIK